MEIDGHLTDNAHAAFLAAVLFHVADVAEHLTSFDVWRPADSSQGDDELKNGEVGADGAWGDRPVRSAYAMAGFEIKSAAEHARAAALAISLNTAIAVETLTPHQTILDVSSSFGGSPTLCWPCAAVLCGFSLDGRLRSKPSLPVSAAGH